MLSAKSPPAKLFQNSNVSLSWEKHPVYFISIIVWLKSIGTFMNLLESQNIQNLLENRLFWRKNSNKRLWAWLIPKTISVKKGEGCKRLFSTNEAWKVVNWTWREEKESFNFIPCSSRKYLGWVFSFHDIFLFDTRGTLCPWHALASFHDWASHSQLRKWTLMLLLS